LRDPRILLQDIRDSCEKVARFSHGLSRDAVLSDEMRLDAILLNLHVIGEAVKKLPADLREKHPEIPWREIAGLRDFIAHAYFALDLDIVWDAVRKDVPELLHKVTRILENLPPGNN
jgi:uncharacterized protein with HEPN domain